MGTVRRSRTIGREQGVMRCFRPLEAMIEPPVARNGRKTPPGTAYGPRRILSPGECTIHGCSYTAINGDHVCAMHADYYRFPCATCGRDLTDIAIERTGGTHCLRCWGRTDDGKAYAAKLRKASALAEKVKS